MDPQYTPAPGYGRLLSSDAPLHPTSFEGWFFTFWAGLIVIVFALPWAFFAWKRRGDLLPLLALLAGGVTSLGEPMLDLVGHLRWAESLPGPAFKNFGLSVPVLIPPCYMLFMGLEAYWVYMMIQKGLTKKQFFMMFAACGITDAIMENPGLAMHAYEYYGKQPFEFGSGFPFYWSFTNGVAICTIGVLIHYVWPMVKDKGWLVVAIIPLGIIGTTMGEFGTGFPVFLAINANIATWLQWVIGSLTLVLAVVWIRVLAEFVATEHTVDWTFWGLFRARFMLPHTREKYINDRTVSPAPSGAAEPVPGKTRVGV